MSYIRIKINEQTQSNVSIYIRIRNFIEQLIFVNGGFQDLSVYPNSRVASHIVGMIFLLPLSIERTFFLNNI